MATERTDPSVRRRDVLTTGAAAALSAVAGCADFVGTTGDTGSDRPLRIGASLPFTGFLAEEGAEMYLGMEYWRQQVNDDGGLLGRPVEFVIYNDRGTKQGGNASYERLLETDDVDLVMGTAGTLATAGGIDALEPRGMPCVFPMSWGSLAWEKDRNWCVPLLPIAQKVPRGLVGVLDDLGLGSFAIVRSSSGYATDLTAGLKAALQDVGIEIHADVVYQRNNADERQAALQEVADSGADVIGGGGSVAEVKPLIRLTQDLETSAETFAWFDFDDTRLFPVAEAAEGMFGPGLWSARADWAGNDEFVEEFHDWAAVRRPDWSNVRLLQHHSPAAYAGARLLQQAVEDAGTVDPTPVRDALWDLETETLCGRFAVDDQGHQVGKRMLVHQYQRHAREIVAPTDLQTAPPRLPSLKRADA